MGGGEQIGRPASAQRLRLDKSPRRSGYEEGTAFRRPFFFVSGRTRAPRPRLATRQRMPKRPEKRGATRATQASVRRRSAPPQFLDSFVAASISGPLCEKRVAG
jgi:hypothetical protein